MLLWIMPPNAGSTCWPAVQRATTVQQMPQPTKQVSQLILIYRYVYINNDTRVLTITLPAAFGCFLTLYITTVYSHSGHSPRKGPQVVCRLSMSQQSGPEYTTPLHPPDSWHSAQHCRKLFVPFTLVTTEGSSLIPWTCLIDERLAVTSVALDPPQIIIRHTRSARTSWNFMTRILSLNYNDCLWLV